MTSWLRRPRGGDFNGTIGRRWAYRRLDSVPNFDLYQIELDCLVLCTNQTVSRPSDLYLDRAAWFIDECIKLSKVDPMYELGATLNDNRAMKIRIFACALELGLSFLDKGLATKSFETPDLIDALGIFFQHDMSGCDFKQLTDRNRDAYMLVADTVESLPLDFLTASNPDWTPGWINLSAHPSDKMMILCPENEDFTAVIPTLLWHDEYTNCRRVWVLHQMDTTMAWNVLGKTMTLGGEGLMEPLNVPSLVFNVT